jgi:hypothetical protein
MEVYSVEYLVDNNTLAFAVTDADKNLVVFMYQPEARESGGGQKLVKKADFHLGQHVNYMFRIRAKITDPSSGGRILTGNIKKYTKPALEPNTLLSTTMTLLRGTPRNCKRCVVVTVICLATAVT